MVHYVRHFLISKNYSIRFASYINQSRNYFIDTDRGPFLLKQNVVFKNPGQRIPELRGDGPGMSISLPVFKDAKPHAPYVLFATPDNDIIHGIRYDELERLGYPMQQFGGEWVQVIPIKNLEVWNK